MQMKEASKAAKEKKQAKKSLSNFMLMEILGISEERSLYILIIIEEASQACRYWTASVCALEDSTSQSCHELT